MFLRFSGVFSKLSKPTISSPSRFDVSSVIGGHTRQQQTTNDNLQTIDTYRQITSTSHRTTRPTLTRRAQLVSKSSDSLQDKTDYLHNAFSKNPNPTPTSLDETLKVTLIPTLRPCQLWPRYDSDYTVHQRHLLNYCTIK